MAVTVRHWRAGDASKSAPGAEQQPQRTWLLVGAHTSTPQSSSARMTVLPSLRSTGPRTAATWMMLRAPSACGLIL